MGRGLTFADWVPWIPTRPSMCLCGDELTPLEPEPMAIRIKSRGNESAEQMMRRFKKLCEKEGLVKDVKRKEYYEKPSERRNRDKRRAAPRS